MSHDPFESIDQHLPTRQLDANEVDALVAAVRTGVAAEHRRRRQRRIGALAAAVLLGVGLAGWWGRQPVSPPTVPSPVLDAVVVEHPVVAEHPVIEADLDDRIEAAEGTRYALEGPRADRVVHLEAGRIRCAVTDRAPGERFRVVVGGDEVEVTGTLFSVVADGERLLAVVVTEGEVVVRLDDGSSRRLGPGDDWTRPVHSEAVPAPVPPPEAPPVRSAPEPTPDSAFSEGLARFDAADYAGALRRFSAITSGPLAADARFWAAVSRVKMGRDDSALQMLQDALKNSVPAERRGTVHCLLGQLHASRGHTEVAQKHLAMAAQDPDPTVAACGG